MKYCGEPGCRNFITSGRYCEDHKRVQKKVKASANKSFYNSQVWKDLKADRYERDGGCCTRCGKFVFKKTAQHHHKVPIVVQPELKLDIENVITVCPSCHAILELEANEIYNHLPNFKKSVQFDWKI